MSLRELKNKITEKENFIRQKSGNPTFKDLTLRRRFNRLAGGSEYCTWERNEIKRERRLSHYDSDSQKFFYCQNDKSGIPCKRYEGGDKVCADTDGSGACPTSCEPVHES